LHKKIYIIDVLLSEIYQSLKIPREMNATEVAQKYPATRYKFLVYWILKARNVGMNQTRWRSSIFHWSTTNLDNIEIYFSKLNGLLAHYREPMENREEKRYANDYFFQQSTQWNFNQTRDIDGNAFRDVYARMFRQLNIRILCFYKKRKPWQAEVAVVFRIISSIMRYEGNFVWNILSFCSSQADRRHFHRTPQCGHFIKSIWTIFPAFAACRSSYVVFITEHSIAS